MPKSKPPISDVAHPDKSAPSPNSKSVIVPARPMVKDPMVNEAATQPDTEPKDAPLVPTRELKVEPPTETAPEELTEEKPEEVAPEEPEIPEIEEKSDETEDSTKDQAKHHADEEAEAAEQTRREAETEKLANSKQYYVPINAVEKRKSKRFVILGVLLSLLLIVAWVDIALDAGLIDLGSLKPVTHFFST